ncbi:MAG TPA: PspC domain-containing protein [Clostridia bacterium]|nr:PspC domain-containing protein [Clostridia bacterium]
MEKRLYRSRENAVIGGVCGGIAEYLDVDPTIVRLIWAFSAFYGGIGILAYLVCLIVIPENRSTAQYTPAKPKRYDYQEGQGSTGKQPGAQVQQDTAPQQDAGVQPDAELQHNNSEQHQPESQYHHDSQRHGNSGRNRILAGTLLICIGGLLLFRRWFYWIDISRYWPVLLIIAGIVVIINGTKNRGESR